MGFNMNEHNKIKLLYDPECFDDYVEEKDEEVQDEKTCCDYFCMECLGLSWADFA